MRRIKQSKYVLFLFLVLAALPVKAQLKPGRDPNQAIDAEYTKKIREYTTESYFNSPLTDYLPSSPTVPTPKVVLGDVAGAPGKLPYVEEVHRYLRLLEKASPRVKVYSIGTSEEGREMIAVAVADEKLLSQLEENRSRLAKLADPRAIRFDDQVADQLVDVSYPVYYITGSIHSPETGSPTALMELTYRLAVDESAYVRNIRQSVITLITPIVEVDGRDRMVDVYNWHLANPQKNWPDLLYWGHYVAHDNNRDAIGLSLKLTRNVLNTFIEWKAQVIHDLHESVPYLYDNTVGDGPYNAWIDPILADEWQMIGWNNVSELTKFGMPGVFAHGNFDTWSPGYLMFVAATHNGISRLYETFGNAGADTLVRTLQPEEYSRTWYRQNPPLPKAKWSQRNNNNYLQTALLTALYYFGDNRKLFLKNFYLKSKRSIEKPRNEGPAAYVFPADDRRPEGQATLLRLLQAQGCEVHRALAPFSVSIKAKTAARTAEDRINNERAKGQAIKEGKGSPKPDERRFPAGSYVVRMDQPYSRTADVLLDRQYWAPNDPQKQVYDDTGWTLGELGNVQVVRVTDPDILDVSMELVVGEVRSKGAVIGKGRTYVVNHNADNGLITLRYRLKNVEVEAAEESFEMGGRKFNRGSFIIRNAQPAELQQAASDLGLQLYAFDSKPEIKTHALKVPRVAVLHTWLNTQTEGWWRLAFDQWQVPFDYISTQVVSRSPELNSKYDVIVFPPTNSTPTEIISGLPMWGNPLPWKTTPLTPNLGKIDATDDMRPGLGWSGLSNLQRFVNRGGLLITATDTVDLAVDAALTPGVTLKQIEKLKAIGVVLQSKMVDPSSPIAYGYSDQLAVYCNNGPIFSLSNIAMSTGSGSRPPRVTGRGGPDDPDAPQGRPFVEAPDSPIAEPWEAEPLTEELRRRGVYVIPPQYRPRVIARYADAKDLLISGLLDGGEEIARRAMVIDVPSGGGHILLFSNNPMWRGQTSGSYFLVFNAILNFDNLNAGRVISQ